MSGDDVEWRTDARPSPIAKDSLASVLTGHGRQLHGHGGLDRSWGTVEVGPNHAGRGLHREGGLGRHRRGRHRDLWARSEPCRSQACRRRDRFGDRCERLSGLPTSTGLDQARQENPVRAVPRQVSRARSQFTALQKRPNRKVPSKPRVSQSIDDYRNAEPVGTRVFNETAGTEGLPARVDPVIDKESLLPCLEQMSGKAQGEMTIAVVRRCRAREPAVAVGCWSFVLPDLDKPNSQVRRDQRAQQGAARGRTQDHGRLALREQVCQGRSEPTQQLSIPPPAGWISPPTAVGAVARFSIGGQ